ncbi:MAG: hypothetical protein ACU0CI_08800 [Shimia sp.]
MRVALALIALTLLAACGDPLGGAARVTEVGLPPGVEDAAQAVPGAEDQADAPPVATELVRDSGLRLWPFGGTRQSREEEPTEAAAATTPRRGLFGPRGDGTAQVTPGTILPYGDIATVCGLATADLGQRIDGYPENRPRYTLYDSAPGTLNQRTHYLTGFKDGCARQFTAALALFGTPDAHEAIRYSSGQRHIPFTPTDRAYEAIRTQTCRGAPVGTPCRQVDRLNRQVAFVSVYERFGTTPEWADILIHDGAIIAKDLKR